MILPSDEDSRQPEDSRPPDEPDDALPWQGEPEPPGYFGDEPEAAPTAPTVHNPAPEGWREDLREDLDDALAELKEIEDPAEDFDPEEPPDLFSFYGELVNMRNTLRLAATSIVQTLKSPEATTGDAGPDMELLAALLGLYDSVEEKNKALLPALTPVMKAAGLVRIKLKPGAAFDRASMTTDDKVRKDSRVAREVLSGWKWHGSVIRPVHVALK